jgi:hypothetical protein
LKKRSIRTPADNLPFFLFKKYHFAKITEDVSPTATASLRFRTPAPRGTARRISGLSTEQRNYS